MWLNVVESVLLLTNLTNIQIVELEFVLVQQKNHIP